MLRATSTYTIMKTIQLSLSAGNIHPAPKVGRFCKETMI